MIDQHGRRIDYLRISLTDRCDLRCVYCMPEGGVPGKLEHAKILRFEEILRIVRILTELGIRHVRLTGGEPMTRRGCLELAAQLHGLPGIESISMTSNGILLKGHVRQAKLAGITSLNLSIDSLDPGTYARLTRGGDVENVLSTLEEALDEGMCVKVNAVPVRGINEGDLAGLAGLAGTKPLCVRFIELMPIGCAAGMEGIPRDEIMRKLVLAFGEPEEDRDVHGHGPAGYVRFRGFAGSVGFISAVSHEFCGHCNRIRLTADGQLKLCLNHTQGLDLRAMLRGGASDGELLGAMRTAIAAKPERHAFYESIGDHEERFMNAIGG